MGVVIIALPFAGPIAYFMFGADRMQRKRLRKAARLGMLRHRSSRLVKQKVEEFPPSESELVRVLTNINQIPPSTADSVRLLIDSTDSTLRCESDPERPAPHPHRVLHLAGR